MQALHPAIHPKLNTHTLEHDIIHVPQSMTSSMSVVQHLISGLAAAELCEQALWCAALAGVALGLARRGTALITNANWSD